MSSTQVSREQLICIHWETRTAFKMFRKVRADSHALGVARDGVCRSLATTITGTACSLSKMV